MDTTVKEQRAWRGKREREREREERILPPPRRADRGVAGYRPGQWSMLWRELSVCPSTTLGHLPSLPYPCDCSESTTERGGGGGRGGGEGEGGRGLLWTSNKEHSNRKIFLRSKISDIQNYSLFREVALYTESEEKGQCLVPSLPPGEERSAAGRDLSSPWWPCREATETRPPPLPSAVQLLHRWIPTTGLQTGLSGMGEWVYVGMSTWVYVEWMNGCVGVCGMGKIKHKKLWYTYTVLCEFETRNLFGANHVIWENEFTRMKVEWNGCMGLWECVSMDVEWEPAGGHRSEVPFWSCTSDRLSELPLPRERQLLESWDHPVGIGVPCLGEWQYEVWKNDKMRYGRMAVWGMGEWQYEVWGNGSMRYGVCGYLVHRGGCQSTQPVLRSDLEL